MVANLWIYRHFILNSVVNEIRGRFARSKLGGMWLVIHPLMQVAIYALILSKLLAAKLPGVESTYAYAVYLMAGMLGWTLFNELLNRGLNLFIENAGLIKKMNFPRVTLPAIATASSLVSGAMLLLAMLLLFPLLGFGFSLAMLWLIPLIAVVTAFGLALGLLLGVINVFLRDLGQATPVVLQVWFWFTPIVYPLDILPEAYRNVIRFNPMCSAVNGFQRVLVYGEPPEMISLIYPAAFVAVLMPIAVLAFRRADEEMADLL